MCLHSSALHFPFTEGHLGKLQVWCRLSAFTPGQQAKIRLKGRCSIDQARPTDCCGYSYGE